MTNRKLAILLAACTSGVLVVMVIISIATGATQERHEHFLPPEAYAMSLLDHAKGLRVLLALDVAFLILYTGFFAALAAFLREHGRPFVKLALGAMIGTAVLDIIEDHHIMALLESAENMVLPKVDEIVFQTTLSMTKFSLSFLALVMFGLAIPRDRKLGLALALFLTAGTLIAGVLGYAAPPEHRATLEGTRWIGFLIGFGLSIAWLRGAPEATAKEA